jgi:hypothetical protein
MAPGVFETEMAVNVLASDAACCLNGHIIPVDGGIVGALTLPVTISS